MGKGECVSALLPETFYVRLSILIQRSRCREAFFGRILQVFGFGRSAGDAEADIAKWHKFSAYNDFATS